MADPGPVEPIGGDVGHDLLERVAHPAVHQRQFGATVDQINVAVELAGEPEPGARPAPHQVDVFGEPHGRDGTQTDGGRTASSR